MKLKRLRDHPKLLEQAAAWFASKWEVPVEAYKESMELCIRQQQGIPQWYVVLDEKQGIIAGAGVIENDFHERRDLTPNLCALFVEENYRCQGIARSILDFIRKDLGEMGVSKVYLITDHMEFYERCGWKFLTMVRCEEGELIRMYEADCCGWDVSLA
ncbi:GNAT family N-acetyltransferase [Ihubacter massiliensis]|uniref:GNAT family N-acetyltransferase n=1 Tax=Hominibacterium faecale TaxID=2839743 RepID=A0A9J6QQX8_9FIRM|nr:GNAT family N-acetyltransferase [Hominibacterium faecale]MCI7300880.1 GNAT family N-acetyltransferase [Clostridia bacterium]MCO7121283.1 GNAT family N-acetyltransferase [Ihubacter massiliensis]MDE8732483.1 GNAT family N-acetyltransferase [Eubacteriales bacterium DFI.9.88]MDY3012776.1 GNAT family N-acetyltransferase [Clostridiales Family XIII bacterium]MCU7378269.1 GNAT family N-acetyltransferase [Hominibacterium faecale]